jgi:hypothetical protein
VHHVGPHLPDVETVAVAEQPVELRPVAAEFGAFVEHLPERVLHDGDLLSDPDAPANPLLEVGRSGQVVGMDVRLEEPFHDKPLAPHMIDDRVGRPGVRAAARVVEVENAVDDRCRSSLRIAHDIGYCICCFVEKRGYMRRHVGSLSCRVYI